MIHHQLIIKSTMEAFALVYSLTKVNFRFDAYIDEIFEECVVME